MSRSSEKRFVWHVKAQYVDQQLYSGPYLDQNPRGGGGAVLFFINIFVTILCSKLFPPPPEGTALVLTHFVLDSVNGLNSIVFCIGTVLTSSSYKKQLLEQWKTIVCHIYLWSVEDHLPIAPHPFQFVPLPYPIWDKMGTFRRSWDFCTIMFCDTGASSGLV